MKRKLMVTLIGLIGVALISAPAFAVPTLQLDIIPGHWVKEAPYNETTISDSKQFTLRAILVPEGEGNPDGSKIAAFTDTFYISAAVWPAVSQTTPPPDFGSFTFTYGGNTTLVEVAKDMFFGDPPLESYLAHDGKDLGQHSVFPTYFSQFNFNFTTTHSDNTADKPSYNTQDINRTIISNNSSYYADFTVDTTGLAPGHFIHFDLYTIVHGKGNGGINYGTTGDLDIGDFAPFSHDAQSNVGPPPVPEPSTMLLLGSGLAGLAGYGRKRFRK